jgi:tRNA A37 N6-isopentenylltransferase MiaA
MTALHAEKQPAEPGQNPAGISLHFLAIQPAHRATLHNRIARRFRDMLQQGLVEEVSQLYNRGDLHDRLPSIRSVGYRQVWRYLTGELSYDDMVEKGIIATRQLAKRQMTWLRSWSDLHVLSTECIGSIENSDSIDSSDSIDGINGIKNSELEKSLRSLLKFVDSVSI